MEDICFPLEKLTEKMSMDLFFPEILSSFFAGLYPRGHLASIFRVPESSCSNAFDSTPMVFLMASS